MTDLPVDQPTDQQPPDRRVPELHVDVAAGEWMVVDALHGAVRVAHLQIRVGHGVPKVGSGAGAHLVVATVATRNRFADGLVVVRWEREAAEWRDGKGFRPEEPPDLDPHILQRRVI